MNGFAHKNYKLVFFLIMCSALVTSLAWQNAALAAQYQIDGYYLGATPEDLGLTVEEDTEFKEKYIEFETGGVLLFFVRAEESGKLLLYRIVKEQQIKGAINSVLGNLKSQYGTPDKQQIRTNSVRPKKNISYVTSAKNRATWKISETQDFIAEVEKNRVVYELLEHNPENISIPSLSQDPEEESPGGGGWNPDY
jgi:hypothetical protein